MDGLSKRRQISITFSVSVMKRSSDSHPTRNRLHRLVRAGMFAVAAFVSIGLMLSPLINLQSLRDYEAGRGVWAAEKLLLRRAKAVSYRVEAAVMDGLWRVFITGPHEASGVAMPAKLRPVNCIAWSGTETAVGTGSLRQTADMWELNGTTRLSAQPSCNQLPGLAPRIADLIPVSVPVGNQRAGNAAAAKPEPDTAAAVNAQTTAPAVGDAGLSAVHPLQSLQSRADCTRGVLLSVVAHQDDDLLFMNPDLMAAIDGGQCVRTVYLTAGDSGQSADYWQGREAGAEAAYAAMYKQPDNWQTGQKSIEGKQVTTADLKNVPGVSLVFMRLPDGNLHGDGFSATGSESLQALLGGTIPDMQTVDGANQFSRDELIAALGAIMSLDKPDQIHTQGLAAMADGDHSDHLAAGAFTLLAAQKYAPDAVVTQYGGYPDKLQLPNLTTDEIAAKQAIFFVYAGHDSAVCQTADACAQTDTYGNYLTREYKEDVPVATDSVAATQ